MERKTMKVLIVDRKENYIKQVVEVLKTIPNISYEAVQSGDDAIEVLFSAMQDGVLFDLVLMDMIMDEMNGEETT